MYDLLVIGGGLAGTIAALCARAAGASVVLANRSWGVTAMSNGAVDIAYTPALSGKHQADRSISEHIEDIIAHRPRHPYGVLGYERCVESLRGGYAVLSVALKNSDLYLEPLDLNAHNEGLVSSLGYVHPAATAYAPHRGFDTHCADNTRWGLVQLVGVPGFDAARIAQGVLRDTEARGESQPELVEIRIDAPLQSAPPVRVACAFEEEGVLRALAERLRPFAAEVHGFVLPPLLGLQHPARACAELADDLGVQVVEGLGHVPSVPGLRLQTSLDEARSYRGVEVIGEVVEPLCREGKLVGARTKDGLEVECAAAVLATGRFVSGGVVWNGRCTEALFGLPVVSEIGLLEDTSPHPVVRETPMESHPLMTAGVWVNPDLQILSEGHVVFDNLFAAGMVIGGFASRYVLCADGVAMATGWLAAQNALEQLGRG